jgi:threonine dehydrogenase-like Zn-dependent dehydrogenase
MKTLAYHVDMNKMAKTIILSKIIGPKAFSKNVSPVYMEEFETPKLPSENFVKVRNIQTGICGSDMTLYTIHQSPKMALAVMPSQTTTYMGHETIGVIEEIGNRVKDLKIGDRVIIKKYLPSCATEGIEEENWCDACKKNDYIMCTNYGEPNRDNHMLGAGFGDVYFAPESCVMKIDDEISNDYACMYEPCAVSLHTVMKHIPKAGDKVVVLGGGMIGLNIVQCIKILQPNCTIYLLEKSVLKQNLAKKLGADEIITGNPYEFIAGKTKAKYYYDKKKKNQVLIGGVDIVFDSIGADWAFNMGIRIIKSRGTYVKVGIQMVTTKIDETPIWHRELNIIGVNSYGVDEYEGKLYQSFDLVDKLVKEGKINLDGFITHRYPLSEFRKGFNEVMFNGQNTIKVIIECDKL